jgi:hypothetical protein
MNFRTVSNRLLMIAAGVCAVAAPSHAHWGPLSSWVRANNSATCNHSHVNGTTTSAVRRARVKVTREWYQPHCEPELRPDQCAVPFQYDVATVTNESSQADIILWGLDDYIPSGLFPFGRFFDNVPRGGVRTLPPPSGKIFLSLRAACQVSDNMTTTL